MKTPPKIVTRSEPATAPAVACSDLLECVVVSIEYNWFCVRNPSGWLLYSVKLSEMPPQGIALADIADELKSKQAEWQRDHDEMEAAEHSNADISHATIKEKHE